MKSTEIAALATALALCLGSANLHAATVHNITASSSGNWNAAGHRTNGNYQIGFSSELPSQQAAFFVVDLGSIKGKTVTAANFTIPGSTDFRITVMWPGHGNGPNFKVGISPQGADSLNTITTGNNNTTTYLNGSSANRNQDLGYGWVPDGLHKGFAFDCFHYHPERLQAEVNAGGRWVFWAVDRFNTGAGSENYIWGSTAYNTGLVLHVTTSN